jgi:uncharacterized protein Yka (UPF0111/DUF47 family)
MVLQSLISWLLPKDDKFFMLLEQQAGVLGDAAKIMASFPENGGTSQAALELIHEVEHRGDDLVHAVVTGLDSTFVTPIDREDLHNLAKALDNVLDYFYRAAQCFVAYEVHHFSPAMRELIQICNDATLVLREAVPLMRQRHMDRLATVRQQLVALEKRGDAVYQTEMAALYNHPDTNAKELLRQQAVLDALEAALDSCQDAADVLENVAVKNS